MSRRTPPSTPRVSRRDALRLGAGAFTATAASLVGAGPLIRVRSAHAQDPAAPAVDDRDRKLLFVVCASGGASIIDSFLPVADSEVGDDALAASLNVYADSLIYEEPTTKLRCVRPIGSYSYFSNSYDMPTFLGKHAADLAVVTQEVTSVNHSVAQHRSLTGAGINAGRTIMEAVAEVQGQGLALPNCNMAQGGYIEPGFDPSVADFARAEIIADPLFFANAMDGSRGILAAPRRELVERARRTRARLEEVSAFGKTFAGSELRTRYLTRRSEAAPRLEALDLITKLMILPPELLPPEYGLSTSPLAGRLPDAFTNVLDDPWESQAALAFLLGYFGLSSAMTIGLSYQPAFRGADIIGTPLAFDYSHNDHRVAQNVMWSRVVRTVDGLISLLKFYDYKGDPALGKMWDRSLIYIATEFGREKHRGGGTGHHLNNGAVLISPMIRGGRVYGGVDPRTLLTYGMNRSSGEPDPTSLLREGDLYSAIAHVMGVEFPGRRNMDALLRG
jgi:hypothetical protein